MLSPDELSEIKERAEKFNVESFFDILKLVAEVEMLQKSHKESIYICLEKDCGSFVVRAPTLLCAKHGKDMVLYKGTLE